MSNRPRIHKKPPSMGCRGQIETGKSSNTGNSAMRSEQDHIGSVKTTGIAADEPYVEALPHDQVKNRHNEHEVYLPSSTWSRSHIRAMIVFASTISPDWNAAQRSAKENSRILMSSSSDANPPPLVA